MFVMSERNLTLSNSFVFLNCTETKKSEKKQFGLKFYKIVFQKRFESR